MNLFQKLAVIDRDLQVSLRIRRYFGVHDGTPLPYLRADLRLCQADFVLALLRLGDRRSRNWITLLLGHPIQVLPPQKRGDPILIKEKKLRVTWRVRENPRHPNTGAHARFELFRPGRTVEEALMRGATPRDFRQALRRNWIHVREV